MSNKCFNLNSTIDISNYNHPDICDVYVFNNESTILGSNGKTYGLFETSGTIIYSIQNVDNVVYISHWLKKYYQKKYSIVKNIESVIINNCFMKI